MGWDQRDIEFMFIGLKYIPLHPHYSLPSLELKGIDQHQDKAWGERGGKGGVISHQELETCKPRLGFHFYPILV